MGKHVQSMLHLEDYFRARHGLILPSELLDAVA